jgi:hypothetical protein
VARYFSEWKKGILPSWLLKRALMSSLLGGRTGPGMKIQLDRGSEDTHCPALPGTIGAPLALTAPTKLSSPGPRGSARAIRVRHLGQVCLATERSLFVVMLNRRRAPLLTYTSAVQIVSHGPAARPGGASVDEDRQEEPAFPSRGHSDICNPELIGSGGGEATTNEIRSSRQLGPSLLGPAFPSS